MKVIDAKKILDGIVSSAVFSDRNAVHYIGVSGGKDSAACIAVAEYAGIEYRPFICDTSHEKGATYKYLMFDLPNAIGRPLKVLKRRYTEEEFARKREYVSRTWSEWATPALRSKEKRMMGVRQMIPPAPQPLIEQALLTLRPSGDALRDCLVIHGTMPQKTGKFCSLELKTELAWAHISEYLDTTHEGGGRLLVVWCTRARKREPKGAQSARGLRDGCVRLRSELPPDLPPNAR